MAGLAIERTRVSRHSVAWAESPPSFRSLRLRGWITGFGAVRIAHGEALDSIFSSRPFLYVFTFGGAVKFGLSRCPEERFRAVLVDVTRAADMGAVRRAAGPGAVLRFSYFGIGGQQLETRIHRYLLRDHLAGEWFRLGHRAKRAIQHLLAQRLIVPEGD
jgi:hypothetical protein